MHVLGTPPAFNLSQDQTLQLRVVSWLRFLIESQSDYFPEAVISHDLPDSLFNCQRTFPFRPGTLAGSADSRRGGRKVYSTPASPERQHLPSFKPGAFAPEGSFYPVIPSQSTLFASSFQNPRLPRRSEVSTRNHWPRQPLIALFLSIPSPFQAAEELSTRSVMPRQLLFRPARIFFSRAAQWAGVSKRPWGRPARRPRGASRAGGSF